MTVKTTTRADPDPPETKWISPDDLLLDPENPRLKQYDSRSNLTQDEILQLLWDRLAVDEVAMSIAAKGFWNFEPIFAVREKGALYVIEGNRRLAAIKLLRDEKLRKKLNANELPKISNKDAQTLENIPVRVVANRHEVWRYLGFKHVNGPAKWGSYAKAQYIAFVKNTAGVTLDEISEQIGDNHRTVKRLYRALMVIDQAERSKVFNREWCYKMSFPFSHLMTALPYEEVQTFLGLAPEGEEKANPVAKNALPNLGEFCRWLFGDSRDQTPPVFRSQNPGLRQLVSVLGNRSALAALRTGEALEAAYEISKGDEIVFEEALEEAKQAMMKAQGRVTSGYDGQLRLLDLAATLADMAHDLFQLMEKKAKPRPVRARVRP